MTGIGIPSAHNKIPRMFFSQLAWFLRTSRQTALFPCEAIWI